MCLHTKTKITLLDFIGIGMDIAKHPFNKAGKSPAEYLNKHALRIWKENYGVSPKVARQAWMRVCRIAVKTKGATLREFFWTLRVLKGGGFQNSVAASLGTTAKTLRKWFWFYLNLLANRVADVVSQQLIHIYTNQSELIYFCIY
jgi:hypothetical protein